MEGGDARKRVDEADTSANLGDVAAAAQVSVSTASRAVRGHPAVSDGARRRVEAAAERLGYEPNRMASALRLRTSPFVGIVVPDIAIPFFGIAVKAAQDVLEDAGYQVLIMNTDRDADSERGALKSLHSHRARGVLLATTGGCDPALRIPHVFFANFEAASTAPRVALSNSEGIRLLVAHLLEHGHERIAYVGGLPNVTSGGERLDGFNAAMAAAGLGERALVGLTDALWSLASAEQAAARLLDLPEPPTAIVAGSDNFALSVLKALHAAGRRIPEDVAVAAFQDPDRVGGVLQPPLTTLVSQEAELGLHAAEMLIRLLTGEEPFAPGAEVRLPAHLVVGRSCGCGETGGV